MSELPAWRRIDTWLRTNAPRTHATITAPPTSNGWWRLAGAQDLIPSIFTPLTSRESIRERARLRSEQEDWFDPEPAGAYSGVFLSDFAPIAAAGNGDYLYIDERPGPESGCVREWCNEGGSIYPTLWPSVHVMFAEIAHSLETGAPVGRNVPEVTDGLLGWRDVD